jgi:hypothetical protein
MKECPKCHHAVSEHYGGCMVEVQDRYSCDVVYCDCDEQFNLATGVRFPNRGELIALLERAADVLSDYGTVSDPLAMEIRRKLKGE